jgi:hypothetical protein
MERLKPRVLHPVNQRLTNFVLLETGKHTCWEEKVDALVDQMAHWTLIDDMV